jgi:hypothetical protein
MEDEMKHLIIRWAAILIFGVAFIATPALAAEKHTGHPMTGKKNHGSTESMQGMEHDQEGTIMLDENEQDGVKTMAHLLPIDPKDMPAGHRATHHLMVTFIDTAVGEPVSSGTVAVKVSSPEGRETEPLKMMPMEDGFGVDVILDQPGTWNFLIAAKLADGKVRRFSISSQMK